MLYDGENQQEREGEGERERRKEGKGKGSREGKEGKEGRETVRGRIHIHTHIHIPHKEQRTSAISYPFSISRSPDQLPHCRYKQMEERMTNGRSSAHSIITTGHVGGRNKSH